MRDLVAACSERAAQRGVFASAAVSTDRAGAGLAAVSMLVVDQDVDGSTGRAGYQASRTPGNLAAFNAETDAHELIRRLEASLRLAVAGHAGRARGGSDGNTAAALKAIKNLGAALPREVRDSKGKLVWPCQELAARPLERVVAMIIQVPAADGVPQASKIMPRP